MKLYMFGHFLCPSSGVFQCTHSNGICHTGLLTAYEQNQDVSKAVWHIPLLCVHLKTPDDGQRNCPKHVEFPSKNKFEKLVHLVGFIIRNLSRCTVTWTSKRHISVLCYPLWVEAYRWTKTKGSQDASQPCIDSKIKSESTLFLLLQD